MPSKTTVWLTVSAVKPPAAALNTVATLEWNEVYFLSLSGTDPTVPKSCRELGETSTDAETPPVKFCLPLDFVVPEPDTSETAPPVLVDWVASPALITTRPP